MKTFRDIVILLNICAVGWLSFLFFEKISRWPHNDCWILLSLILLFMCNLGIIFRMNILTGKGWISLWFQRKALEERKKIEALTKGDVK